MMVVLRAQRTPTGRMTQVQSTATDVRLGAATQSVAMVDSRVKANEQSELEIGRHKTM